MFILIFSKILWIILIFSINNQAMAISGQEISQKVSQWLVNEGVNGSPIFQIRLFLKIVIKK